MAKKNASKERGRSFQFRYHCDVVTVKGGKYLARGRVFESKEACFTYLDT